MARRETFSSGVITLADSPKVVIDHDCYLVAAHLYTDGVNDAQLNIYDNASAASGLVLAQYKAKGEELQLGEGNMWVRARNGLVVELSGTGSQALIRYAYVSPSA